MAEDDVSPQSGLQAVSEWEGGFSWISYPEEQEQRSSHALQTESGVWLIDPVDVDGLDDRVAHLGDVTGVLVLQDRHTRDATELARRHTVSVHIPEWMTLVRTKLDASPEFVADTLPGTNYTIHQLINTEEWEEAILVDESTNTMIVPEAVGTLPLFQANDNQLGVHPELEEPPRKLAEWRPDRLLVGHGESLFKDAASQLDEVLDFEE
jgi:hypothetical protein